MAVFAFLTQDSFVEAGKKCKKEKAELLQMYQIKIESLCNQIIVKNSNLTEGIIYNDNREIIKKPWDPHNTKNRRLGEVVSFCESGGQNHQEELEYNLDRSLAYSPLKDLHEFITTIKMRGALCKEKKTKS